LPYIILFETIDQEKKAR